MERLDRHHYSVLGGVFEVGRTVRVAIAGTGFAARFHLASYRKVWGVDFEIAAICGRNPRTTEALAQAFGIPRRFSSLDALIADPDIDVIDVCLPNHLHGAVLLQAAQAGKHIICEKPLGGYFGPVGAGDDWSAAGVSRLAMLEAVVAESLALKAAVERSGVTFCYAENWVYAPPIAKVDRLMAASGSAIMRIDAEESHSGSHSPYSRRWRTSGGGSLIRLGAHPIGGALYLKAEEGRRRSGTPIRPIAVTAQVANLTEMAAFRAQEPKHMATGWEDVEDWAGATITFDDGSVAQITSTDTQIGGIHNRLTAHGSRAVAIANINPSTSCQAYTPDGRYFADEYLVEKAGKPRRVGRFPPLMRTPSPATPRNCATLSSRSPTAAGPKAT